MKNAKTFNGHGVKALAGTLSIDAPPQDRDDHHDNGKHEGQEKHEDQGDGGDRHDHGQHKGWGSPHNSHAKWDAEHNRIHPGRAYPYRRYEHVKGDIIARGTDFRTRRVVLYDNSNWVVPPTISMAAAIGKGAATAFMCTTTIITLASICCSTPVWAGASTSNIPACTRIRSAPWHLQEK